jgi:hypothetical protein
VDVRVRYAVLDGQVAQDQAEPEDGVGPEHYLIQKWPAAPTPPRFVVSTSPWSQYWTFGGPAKDLLTELADIPDPDRIVVVIDRALAAHPDVAERVRAGDRRYHVGLIRYLQELFSISYASDAYVDLRDDHERIAHLIHERAQIHDR